ncbi:polysaccharide pyruvyl transferase family protein [Proteiniphilum acetatigenes]|uniref:polysaccharide pyruvyl transferase family protein n=1 Tax=Proteiniphilum acetatigenes TaxID=294710 RepID=UPI000380B998|nr:polysaccharide pyruvyl transferase family protein [Proteiniphilum acetatigenes]SFL31995.1 Polysaccharide pyruvyl transferase [Porphyromonadaceae bacterium KH3CP3RA]
MKVGILTFHNAHNYGAILQSYALLHILKSLKFEASIINYRVKSIDEYYNLWKKPNIYLRGLKKSPFHFIYRIFKTIIEIPFKYLRRRKFISFQKSYLELASIADNIIWDAIVCGSDQIWNPRHTKGLRKEYFGYFPKSPQNISYAASIGEHDFFDEKEQIEFKNLLNNLDIISVREIKTKLICQKLTGRDVKLVLDPVFLLSKKEWDLLEIKPKISDRYILIYDLNKDPLIMERAIHLSKKNKLRIIEIEVSDFSPSKWKKIYSAGPLEFIGWIKNAEFIFTSSYHGTIFSILYNKNFYSSDIARINDLLNQIGLSSRILSDFNKEILPINNAEYELVNNLINRRIDESKSFLINSLKMNKN